MTALQQIEAEQAHRQNAPMIEWNHVVKLPSGEHERVNRFDYNLAVCAKAFDRYIQLDDTGWIRVGNLTVVEFPESTLTTA